MSSVKINGLENFLEQSKFYTLTDLDFLNLAEGGADTRKTTRTRAGVRTSYDMGNNFK